MRRDGDRYTAGIPEARDTLLVIEVADSSLAHDRDVKRPLYARSGVAELWIVDLAAGWWRSAGRLGAMHIQMFPH